MRIQNIALGNTGRQISLNKTIMTQNIQPEERSSSKLTAVPANYFSFVHKSAPTFKAGKTGYDNPENMIEIISKQQDGSVLTYKFSITREARQRMAELGVKKEDVQKAIEKGIYYDNSDNVYLKNDSKTPLTLEEITKAKKNGDLNTYKIRGPIKFNVVHGNLQLEITSNPRDNGINEISKVSASLGRRSMNDVRSRVQGVENFKQE